MRHIIYKITNTINGRYYIGRHSTDNINDGYLGSGKAIINAVAKYGKECFTKEIIAEAFSRDDLWELEKEIVNDEIVNDPKSYNMAYGGKHYLHGLKQYNPEKFIKHQKQAGKIGGPRSYNKKTKAEQTDWHKKGGYASVQVHAQNHNHPFTNGTAASLGGKALKGMLELWSPDAIATNKNQATYKTGDCIRANPLSEKYLHLRQNGWLTVAEHRKKIHLR